MKLNVITLFSGYDSQCLALDRLKRHNPQFDYDLVKPNPDNRLMQI